MAREKKTYKCYECGKTTLNYNEGQCPHCMTLDSLLPLDKEILDTDEKDFFFNIFDPDETDYY